jgi:hypothetical protein
MQSEAHDLTGANGLRHGGDSGQSRKMGPSLRTLTDTRGMCPRMPLREHTDHPLRRDPGWPPRPPDYRPYRRLRARSLRLPSSLNVMPVGAATRRQLADLSGRPATVPSTRGSHVGSHRRPTPDRMEIRVFASLDLPAIQTQLDTSADTKDLVRIQARPMSRGGWTCPGMAAACTNRGWMWPGSAGSLATLAPSLAPSQVISIANIRRASLLS